MKSGPPVENLCNTFQNKKPMNSLKDSEVYSKFLSIFIAEYL